MKSKSKPSRVTERYGMIEPLEPRIAPAAAGTVYLPANPTFVTVTSGGSLLIKAGEVLTTGSGGGGSYLLYVAQGQVLVHTTDLNHSNSVDFNEITGLSVGAGAVIVSFVDIHGDIVTDLNPDGTLSDGGKGDILLDNNIVEIDMRSLTTTDFTATATATQAQLVNDHLAMSNYSIFGNIYAGGGLGLNNDTSSGLAIDNSGVSLQTTKFAGVNGLDYYQQAEPVVGSIYAGSSASGHAFSFGSSGSATDVFGNLLAFIPSAGEAGASIYNIGAANVGQPFSIGTLHAGDGGFNAPGGNIVNVALSGDNAGTYQLIAGNAGTGNVGQVGGSIVNFSETGVVISEVVLQSGNGGTGLTGAGGSAGQITFNTASSIAVNAHFVLNYGNGGDGYTGGGAGGGTPSGTFTTPTGQLTNALNLVTTMHTIGSIGTNVPFDFNNDGFSDAVFSTSNPNQVVVAFGNHTPVTDGGFLGGYGLNASSYIFLNSPAQVDSIVVGDFTGNGHPDIAVASGSGTNAGIEVYLSEYSPTTGAFLGFSDPLFSPLPSLANTEIYNYTTTPILKLAAGDFAGNGVMGLAVLTEERVAQTGALESILFFLSGETNKTHPGGSGYFYADYSYGEPFSDLGTVAASSVILQPTALKTFSPTVPGHASNGHDVLIESTVGGNGFNVLDASFGAPFISTNGYEFSFGKVDTNRKLDVGTTINESQTGLSALAIAVTQDEVNPNFADVVVLSQAPADFLEIFQGNGGIISFTKPLFTLSTGDNVDQAGIYFGTTNSNPVGMVAVPNVAGTAFTDVAILDYATNGADLIYVLNVTESTTALTKVATLTEAAGVTATAVRSGTEFWGTIAPANGRNMATVVFGYYDPHPAADGALLGSGPDQIAFITANPLENYPNDQDFAVSQPYYSVKVNGATSTEGGGIVEAPFKVAGYYFNAGNGGSSESGPGGAGGTLGQSLNTSGSTPAGTLSVLYPTDLDYEGEIIFTAGNGGNGFNAGGAGGNLVGLSVTYPPNIVETSFAELFAGNGGQSLTGTGGVGGSESQLYIQSGDYFQAGNGGIGVVGGGGGALEGNTQPGLITASTSNVDQDIQLQGGNGAMGILGGGGGGSITSFVNLFNGFVYGIGGYLDYVAGNGGNAVGGAAGAGGSILNSSPNSGDNNLAGDIYLEAGSGGSGSSGGAGGNIDNFSQVSTISEVPTSFTIFAGFGGNGTIGNGGVGGYVTNISVSASGYGSNLVDVNFNRVVAGAGGSSAGGTGGAGGYISSVNTASIAATSQDVLAAGAGGEGLTAGGAGGSIASAIADAGSNAGTGKVVVIAGDGGASYSAKPAASTNAAQMAENIVYAVGGVNGPGGAGGTINSFVQEGSVSTHVDLIAGNGGATVNHSEAAQNATVDNSGVGGSILNVSIQGSIGNSDATVAIKSYNDIFAGQTMQDFVDTYIIADETAVMSDSIGNVGLVAGAAGRVEGGLPSMNGINGSVSNVHAENIMSMVAGNVDQVDLIRSLTNYGVTITDGILGATKTEYYNPVTGADESVVDGKALVATQIKYFEVDGALDTTPLPGGGELIDGAFLAQNIRKIQSPRDFQGTVPS
jgi:hypothetical protein